MNKPAVQPDKRTPYPTYKPSGLEWLGEVPEHWDVRRLKYTASINDESLPETTDPDYEFNYIDIGSVDATKGIVAIEVHRFEDAPSRARRIVRDGDTIVSTVRTYLRAIAPICEPDDHLIVSTGFAVVRPRSLDPGYLSYMMRSPFFVETVVSRSIGVSYPAINAPEVGDIAISIPSPDEQQAIAAFLDRETSKIDSLISKKRQLIELLKEKRTAMISRAVTKGLNLDASMKSSGIDWLGDVPKHWTSNKLGFMVDMRGGSTPSKNNNLYWNGSIPWVSPKDMKSLVIQDSKDHISELALEEATLKLFDPPVVLMVVRGMILAHTFPVGITSAPVTINQDMKALTPRRGCITEYLLHLLNGISNVVLGIVEESAHGTKVLRLPVWNRLAVYIPKEDEQKIICDHINVSCKRYDSLIAKVKSAIKHLREHRSALVSAAVTGKIDVRSPSVRSKK